MVLICEFLLYKTLSRLCTGTQGMKGISHSQMSKLSQKTTGDLEWMAEQSLSPQADGWGQDRVGAPSPEPGSEDGTPPGAGQEAGGEDSGEDGTPPEIGWVELVIAAAQRTLALETAAAHELKAAAVELGAGVGRAADWRPRAEVIWTTDWELERSVDSFVVLGSGVSVQLGS